MDRGRVSAAWVTGLVVAVLSFRPTRNYDYFWHLATGRWITDHLAIPSSDPFTLAARGPWINLEWLFDVAVYGLWKILGHAGLTVVMALGAGLTAALVTWLASRRLSPAAAGSLVVVGLAGLLFRLDIRPETASVPLFLLVVWLVVEAPSARRAWILAVIVIVWVNVHPSALLAPILVATVWLSETIERRSREEHRFRAAELAATLAALIANPWGWNGIVAPFRLAGALEKATGFMNAEWRASGLGTFPLFWIVVLFGIAMAIASRNRDLSRLALFALLAILAARYARNQIYFFAALPLLIEIPAAWSSRLARGSMVAISAIVALVATGSREWGAGVARGIFPVHTSGIVTGNGLDGAIYNPDQLGGYLIWTFYPERRVLTDGRNELHMDYILELRDALGDSRRWDALMQRYDPSIAFDDYRSPIEVIDAKTGAKSLMPASGAFFPRSRWALIGFDDAAMLFVRRDRFGPELIERLEYRALVPDSPTGLSPRPAERSAVGRELERSRERGDTSPAIRRLISMTAQP